MIVSDKGGRRGYVVRSRWDAYRALRRKGASKSKAARIANEGRTRVARKAMAKKGAATRRRRGRK